MKDTSCTGLASTSDSQALSLKLLLDSEAMPVAATIVAAGFQIQASVARPGRPWATGSGHIIPGKPLPELDHGLLAHYPLHTCIWVFLPLPSLLCNQGQPAPLMDKCVPCIFSLLCRHCQTCSLPDVLCRKKWVFLAPALFPHSWTPWRMLQVCVWKVAKWLLLRTCHSTLKLPLGGLYLKVWQQHLIPPEPVTGSPGERGAKLCRVVRF